MNEHIDILFTTAKCATRNDPWAHWATHSISTIYNVALIGHYRYQLGMMSNTGNAYVNPSVLRQYKADLLKHTVLGGLDILGLFVSAIGSIVDGGR